MEMLPLARELFQRREAYQVLERLISNGSAGMCIFFVPGSSESIDGHCFYYSYRPTVCRLFGFAAWKNKRGIQEAAFCKRQKEWSPALVATAEDAISKGLNPPDYTHFSIRFSALDNKLMPINRAIHLAVERYGLRVQMAEATVVGRDSQHGGIHGSQAAVSFGKAA
jgi:Fe-S-cluster containining protein